MSTTKERIKALYDARGEKDARESAEAVAQEAAREAYDAAYKKEYEWGIQDGGEGCTPTDLEYLFYQALKYAAPDLDFTAMPHAEPWDGAIAFRINNGPVDEELNSILGINWHDDPETGEDIMTVAPGVLEETILDLRDFAAAREHAELDDAGLVDTAAMQGEGDPVISVVPVKEINKVADAVVKADESSAPTGA